LTEKEEHHHSTTVAVTSLGELAGKIEQCLESSLGAWRKKGRGFRRNEGGKKEESSTATIVFRKKSGKCEKDRSLPSWPCPDPAPTPEPRGEGQMKIEVSRGMCGEPEMQPKP